MAPPAGPKAAFAVQRGPFVKACPCTPGAVGCGLQNANLHTGCPFRCSYCILQEYLPTMRPIFFRNWRRLDEELARLEGGAARLTSGELSDSLAWEGVHATAGRLLSLLAGHPGVVFEFKTKSDRIGAFLSRRRPLPQVVVSWSLAPAPVAAVEEAGAPSLQRRLEAMAAVAARGFRVGVHFDPLVLHPGWRPAYRGLIRSVAAAVPAGRIAWWSLGGLRFSPALKRHIFRRPRSRLFWGELVPGFDGKYRYFKPLRLELFRFVAAEIRRQVSAEIPLYLCMEDEEAWREILPQFPPDPETINARLYQSVFRT